MTHNSNILQLLLNNCAGCSFFVSLAADKPRRWDVLPNGEGCFGMGMSDPAAIGEGLGGKGAITEGSAPPLKAKPSQPGNI